MKNFITFFAKNKNTDRNELVGIGLTDEMIEHIKKTGAVMSEAQRNQMATDVVIFYAPTEAEVVRKITDVLPHQVEVRVI